MSQTISIDPENLRRDEITLATDILKKGGVVIYPTDTVYGLGVDAENSMAIQRLFALKKRDLSKSISVMVSNIASAQHYLTEISEIGKQLMQAFWPGALTIVGKSSPSVAEALQEKDATIGIRIPDNNLCLRLTEAFGKPITTTSANLSGDPECSSIEHIDTAIRSSAELILDAGITQGTVPSTVISIVNGEPLILREGAVTKNEIKNVLDIDCAVM